MEKYNHSDACNDHFEDFYVSLGGNTEDMMLSRKNQTFKLYLHINYLSVEIIYNYD